MPRKTKKPDSPSTRPLPITSSNAVPKSFGHRGQLKQTVTIIPKNPRQEQMLEHLNDEDIRLVCAIGEAGCGKTYMGVAWAVQQLEAKKISKIILTKPLATIDNVQIGALPGDLYEKLEIYYKNLLEFLELWYSKKDILLMIENGVIAIEPLNFLRGRNFAYPCAVIADELQNSTVNECMALMSRAGENAKFIISGDLEQRDRRFSADCGLEDLMKRLSRNPNPLVGITEFAEGDSVRSPLVSYILKLYKDKL